MRKIFTKFLGVVLVASTLVGCGAKEEGAKVSESAPEVFKEKAGELKIMVIRKIGGDDHTAQFLAGAKEEGESLGVQVDTFTANGDSAKFHDAINQAVEKKYNAVVLSHGDDEQTVNDVQKLRDAGIEVVTFDTNPAVGEIAGVSTTAQDDASLASLALEALKVELGESGKLSYLWVDGFPPMVNRNVVYKKFLDENKGYTEVARFGVAAADTSVQTQNAVNAQLTKFKPGELTGIFATWDAFAIGADRAIKESGRKDIKLVGIDVSSADLKAMQEENSPWIATAACDPRLVGKINVRLAVQKIAGEETPNNVLVKASLITQKQLLDAGGKVTMDNLHEVVDGFGQSDEYLSNWMKETKELNKK
ncbi:MAG: sugar ABC transporter substrate-binding protein [Bacilli bacterium]